MTFGATIYDVEMEIGTRSLADNAFEGLVRCHPNSSACSYKKIGSKLTKFPQPMPISHDPEILILHTKNVTTVTKKKPPNNDEIQPHPKFYRHHTK